jgi:Spy/CpxP family protein refolding chaperone
LLLVFLGGVSLGAGAVRLGLFGLPHASASPANMGVWKESDKILYVENLRRELDLTPAQAKEIETALDDLVMFYQNLQTQMDDLRAQGKSRIVRVLTDEQRKKFEHRLDKFRAPAH